MESNVVAVFYFFSYDSQLSAATEITADETGMAYCIFVVRKMTLIEKKKIGCQANKEIDIEEARMKGEFTKTLRQVPLNSHNI